jgi:hypothetical protein
LFLGEGYFEYDDFHMGCRFGGRHCGLSLKGKREEAKRYFPTRQKKGPMPCQHLLQVEFPQPSCALEDRDCGILCGVPRPPHGPQTNDSQVCRFPREPLPLGLTCGQARGGGAPAAVHPDGMLTELCGHRRREGFTSPTQGTHPPLAGVELCLSQLLRD